MRIFYSHPMKLYGTSAEQRELVQILKRFPGDEIVNPRDYQSQVPPDQELDFYLRLVESCDCLVFSRHFGYITEGVKPEVEYALSKGKPVFELRDEKFLPVTGPVANLPASRRLLLRAKAVLGMG